MPKGIDWIYLLYVNLGYFTLTIAIYIFSYINDIKENWPQYRCNPIYMPLSDDIQADFTYCVQNMQMNYMGYLLEPLVYITDNLSQMGFGFTDSLNSIRNVISNIRTFLASIADSIMGVFANITVESQKLTIGLQHLVGKIIGTMVVFMYMMEGSVQTMTSMWMGPSGDLIRVMGGSCFDPDTLVERIDGSIVAMKNIQPEDVLINGAVVKAVMNIASNPSETFYCFSRGSQRSSIFVTGSHYIKYKDTFIHVKNHPDAIPCSFHKTKWLSCLITSDHSIVLGDRHFYDWEDYHLDKSG